MLIEYSKIVGLPVFELENQQRLAQIIDLIVDEDDGSIKAFLVKKHQLFAKKQIIVFKEVTDLSKQAVLVQSADSVADPDEVVRISKKLNKRAEIIGENVITKNGVNIGKVYDYVIESETGGLVRLYVKKIFDEKIIHSSAIEKIDHDKIVIKDNFERAKPEMLVPDGKIKLA